MNIHRSCSCRVLVVLLAAVLLSGCAARVPYPADWEPMAGSAAGRQDPSGRFRDRPDITSHDEAAHLGLPLTEIFFGSLLEGIAVTSRTTLDTGALVVDYFDVDPFKDGQYFWHAHNITRPLDEWLALDAEGLAAEIAVAARSVACRVQQELEPYGGAAPDSSCHTTVPGTNRRAK